MSITKVESRPPQRRRRSLSQKAEPYAFMAPTALLMVVLMMVPIIIVIGYSFMDNVILNKNPELVSFENYVEVITDSTFQKAVGNTLFFCHP